MKKISKNAMIGYPAGIITGITYGLNPLFGIPLMNEGASVEYIRFFRYGFAVLLLGAFLLLSGQKFRVTAKQSAVFFMIVSTKRYPDCLIDASSRKLQISLLFQLGFVYLQTSKQEKVI